MEQDTHTMNKTVDDKPNVFESLIDTAEDYGRSSIELLKLKAIKKVSELVSNVAASLVVMFTTVLFTLILSIGLSLWLGEYLGKSYYGFFAVAGLYLLVAIIVMAAKKQLIKTPVSNAIIKNIID